MTIKIYFGNWECHTQSLTDYYVYSIIALLMKILHIFAATVLVIVVLSYGPITKIVIKVSLCGFQV